MRVKAISKIKNMMTNSYMQLYNCLLFVTKAMKRDVNSFQASSQRNADDIPKFCVGSEKRAMCDQMKAIDGPDTINLYIFLGIIAL